MKRAWHANTEWTTEDWVARLQSPECSGEDRAAWRVWLDEHPEQADEAARMQRIYDLSGTLTDDAWLNTAARRARRDAVRGRRRRGAQHVWAGAAAACLLLLAGVAAWYALSLQGVQTQEFATNIGEQRTLYLDDGTAVLLDTNSAVNVGFGPHERHVTLLRGRAQFQVAPDPERPFVVRAGVGLVHDIGTLFQVRLQSGQATVTLLSGRVRVQLPDSQAQRSLAPGQRIQYGKQQGLGELQTFNLAVARGWTRGEMIFHDRTLADTLAEMNRYSSVKLLLGTPALGSLRISGVFHAGDQESMAQALRQGWGLRVKRISPAVLELLPPASANNAGAG